jgi:hypothetical protein
MKFWPQWHTQNSNQFWPQWHTQNSNQNSAVHSSRNAVPSGQQIPHGSATPFKFWCVLACLSIMFHCYRSVSVVSRLGSERSWDSWIPGMDKRVPLYQNAQTACGFHPAYYSIDTGCSFPGVKRSGPELYHCAPPNVELKVSGTQLWIL